ncbi:unnamed protein product, partial [Ectocarpus sp. 12 AP-2014]
GGRSPCGGREVRFVSNVGLGHHGRSPTTRARVRRPASRPRPLLVLAQECDRLPGVRRAIPEAGGSRFRDDGCAAAEPYRRDHRPRHAREWYHRHRC